jgi:hypothetical protein
VLLHRAVSALSDVDAQNDQSLLQFFDKTPSGVPPSRDIFYRKLLTTPDSKLPLLSYKVRVNIESFTAFDVEDRATETGASHHHSVHHRQCLAQQDESLFLIVSGLRGGEAKAMACDESNRHLKLVPMGAVAACVCRRTYYPSTEKRQQFLLPENAPESTVLFPLAGSEEGSSSAGIQLFPGTNGQAFCFLPLPVRTQMPVHVNAYWELSSNRRDIWR